MKTEGLESKGAQQWHCKGWQHGAGAAARQAMPSVVQKSASSPSLRCLSPPACVRTNQPQDLCASVSSSVS